MDIINLNYIAMSQINLSSSTNSQEPSDSNEKSQTESMINRSNEDLKKSGNKFDLELATIIEKAADMSRTRESLILKLLNPDVLITDKVLIRKQLKDLQETNLRIIMEAIDNRLMKAGVSNVDKLFSLSPATGYFHFIQANSEYPKRLNEEEKLRALEPSCEVQINTEEPALYSIIIRSIVEVADFLSQFSILISSKSSENDYIIDRTVILREGNLIVPVIKTMRHVFDIEIILPKASIIKIGITENIIKNVFDKFDLETEVAEGLARHGISGGTFINSQANLLYIRPYDPDHREYYVWIKEVITVINEIRETIIRRIITELVLQKMEVPDALYKLFSYKIEIDQKNLIVAEQNNFNDRFAKYNILLNDTEEGKSLRAKIYNYLVHGII